MQGLHRVLYGVIDVACCLMCLCVYMCDCIVVGGKEASVLSAEAQRLAAHATQLQVTTTHNTL